MSNSDSSIFASKPFTFIVQGKQLFVHAALVAECSGPLDRMINGHFSEAQQGFAVLEDVDEGTFTRFIRWAYNQDYSAPGHTLVEIANESSAPNPTAKTQKELDDNLDWGEWGTKKDKKKKKVGYSSSTLKGSFITQYDLLGLDLPVGRSVPAGPRGNYTPEEDYSEVFLGHARMYVFAENYDIRPLKTLALVKLHQSLSIFTLFPERVGDITTLLKYVYANTAETINGTEDIRTMLAHYVGCEMETLAKDGQIKDLLLENGEMLGDLLNMFALRVS